MKFFPPEPEVDLYSEGFGESDFLGRKKSGEALSNLLDRVSDPIVVALDGRWGTGKTYFLKRWVGAHTIENKSNATTIYFDAFANDYLLDPLPSLVSALADRLPKKKNSQVDRLKNAAFKMAKPITKVGLATLTYGATEALSGVGDAIVNSASKEGATGLDKYWSEQKSKRAAMVDFRKTLETLTKPSKAGGEGSSVVIVIDELDRCRPDYALEVIEVIKHFFTVPHLHFVLGVNLSTLENSVRVRYGNRIDAHSYLKKFIQVTLELPEVIGNEHAQTPSSVIYLDHLLEEMEVPKHVGNRLLEQVEQLTSSTHFSMRDIGQIVSSLCLASEAILGNERRLPGWVELMNDLVITRIIRPDIYAKILDSSLKREDILDYLNLSNEMLQEEIDGNLNPLYDHKKYWRYMVWIFVIGNGHMEGVDPGLVRAIGKQFDTMGLPRNPSEIPRNIQRNWLDQLNFYSPDES